MPKYENLTTIRKMLTEKGIDWNNSTIILQAWTGGEMGCRVRTASVIQLDNPILDVTIKLEHDGGADAWCPSVIAADLEAIYVVIDHDWSRSVMRVYKDVARYLMEDLPLLDGS